MKVAVVHDWLVTYAGAERVLEQMLACYPQADLYALVDWIPEGQRGFLQNKAVLTSFVQRLPGARSRYRGYLPLMPLAVEQFDLSAYDLIISSSHAVAKGVLTGPDQLHICMCYSPIRYAWDLQHQYLKESGLSRGVKGWLAKWLLHKLRIWDLRTVNGVDRFVAISGFIARRIEKIYRRSSEIIYPPVDLESFSVCEKKDDFYLTASRMVPYKKIDLIVEAFSAMPDKRLVVIGDGPDMKKIRNKAGSNVQLLGHQPFEVLRDHMQRARAFVFAAEEDFGIAPVEAQACGTPVIAFGKGGVLETIVGTGSHLAQQLALDGPTGLFFAEQTTAALHDAIREFESRREVFVPQNCRRNAERFGIDRFRDEFKAFVDRATEDFGSTRLTGEPLA